MRIKKTDIRKVDSNEASLLNFVIRQCFADVARRFHLTPENCPTHPSNSTVDKVIEDLSKGTAFFLKIDKGIPAGCVGLEKADNDTCYVVRLGVLPGRRGRGFGKELLDKAVHEAGKLGAKTLSAAIIAEDDKLKRWYEKNGFIDSGTQDIKNLPFRVTFMNLELKAADFTKTYCF